MSSYFKQAREWATPTLKTSAFETRGVLTPEEFNIAGDELVYRCPTWSWESGQKIRSHLPADKQFLVTRNVPCIHRCSEVENSGLVLVEDVDILRDAMSGDNDDDSEGWMVSRKVQKKSFEDDFDMIDAEGECVQHDSSLSSGVVGDIKSASLPNQAVSENDVDDNEYADMADFEDDNIIQDDAIVEIDPTENENIIKVRSYDISITYDKYYQTPRIWLFGYDESGNPLPAEKMFEDCMSDYVKRTVTLESHPHLSGIYASIHPCQHGKVMQNIVRNLSKSGGTPSVENYLFIFLKFISSIIPTINYDFTMEVEASVGKQS